MSRAARQMMSLLFSARNWSPTSSTVDICSPSRLSGKLHLSGITPNRLVKLKVDFVGDRHHIREEDAVVDVDEIVLQSMKNADLQDSIFFQQHGGGVPLKETICTMLGSA